MASYTDTGLAPSTQYTYRVSALDAVGNESAQSAPVSATTSSSTDTTPPVLSGVATNNVTSTSATITWSTNEGASSRVDYGTTTAYGSTASQSGLRTLHSLTIADLQPSTTYHVRAVSVDGGGNQGMSVDIPFTTQTVPSGPADAVANWRFDEGSGTAVRDAVGGYNGTLVNGARWQPDIQSRELASMALTISFPCQPSTSLDKR
jgi:purple acid phosphatase-like protein